MLRLSKIEKSYGVKTVVNSVSLEFQTAKTYALIGPSGCGKSTLLALISGTPIFNVNWIGEIRLNGIDIGALPAHRRSVGIMYQDALLFPHLTVGENLAFGLASSIRSKARHEAVQNALAAASLDGFGERDPASLSGGQASRIALMRALLAEPKALLMDEAFSSLDPDLRRQFGQFVATQVRLKQIPALLVSHDVADRQFAIEPVLNFSKG